MTLHRAILFLNFLALAIQVCCSPSEHNLTHCRNPNGRYERVETYSVDWFLDHVRADVRERYKNAKNKTAPLNNTLFYTRNMSEIAKKYACNASLITIWEPWEPALYDNSTLESNMYSCIHHNETSRNVYFENMSEAFATMATGLVHVMHSPADYDKPPMEGIWGRVEQKALRNRVHVTTISRLSGNDRSTIQEIWERVEGWLVKYLPAHFSGRCDQMELKRKLRKRSERTQVPMGEDIEDSSCPLLPVNTLHVDW